MYNGILNIYKEKGYTSHDVVAKLRGILRQKKIGHTGTLDPDAEGVLPICLGNATKLCDMMTDKRKSYECVMRLGVSTDTQDMTGEVTARADESIMRELTEERVTDAVKYFIGEYEQLPPMYSAVKVNGKRLYEFAREGMEVERKRRRVVIYGIDILSVNLPFVTFRAECSKGTYIRTLCSDIGDRLGCGGAMEKLVRIKSGDFDIEGAITLKTAEEYASSGCIEKYIVSTEKILQEYGSIVVKQEYDGLLYNGNSIGESKVKVSDDRGTDMVKVYDSKGNFMALYEYVQAKREYRNRKMFL